MRGLGFLSLITSLLTIVLVSPANAAAVGSDRVRDKQWYLSTLEIQKAHSLSNGAGVIVAVVDTGVSPHSDLKNNLLVGKDVSGSNDGTIDKNGHGTGMAGIIAAHGRANQMGMLGIAPAAKILPIRTTTQENTDPQAIAAGMEVAASEGAGVINVSAALAPAIDLQDAVAHAIEKDALIVAGVGNYPRMISIGYPAATPGVLAVGAVDQKKNHAEISVTGSEVLICAPGIAIESTRLNDKYSVKDGTSSATAIVSGAAALVRSKFPELTAPQVIQRLTATADDIGPPGRDDECGFGVLNIVKALTADVPVSAGPSTPASGPASQEAQPSNVASPGSDSPGINMLAVLGGILGLVLVGGLVGVLALRRRQRS